MTFSIQILQYYRRAAEYRDLPLHLTLSTPADNQTSWTSTSLNFSVQERAMAAVNGNNQNQISPRRPLMLLLEEDYTELTPTKDTEELESSQMRLLITPNYANKKLFEEFNSQLGGRGIRAARNITRGTPIISERAHFSKLDGDRVTQHDANDQQFGALVCPIQQPPTWQEEANARFEANSFGMGTDGNGRERHGIFLRASRFNHSCVPNAHFAWNFRTTRLTVHALENIPRGGEIFVNYGTYDFTTMSRVQRQNDLMTSYNFNCTCRACSQNPILGIESENRRDTMRKLQGRIDQHKNAVTFSGRLSQLERIRSFTALLHDEGLIYPQPADMYQEEIDWFTREIGNNSLGPLDAMYTAKCREEALQLARNKLDLDVAFTGHNSQVVRGTLTTIRDVKNT